MARASRSAHGRPTPRPRVQFRPHSVHKRTQASAPARPREGLRTATVRNPSSADHPPRPCAFSDSSPRPGTLNPEQALAMRRPGHDQESGMAPCCGTIGRRKAVDRACARSSPGMARLPASTPSINAGEGDVVAYVTFMGVPPGQPATIGVPHEEAPCWGGRRLWLSALRMVGGRRPLQRWRPRRLQEPFMAAPYGRPP
jgi:hypothetical protein